MELRQKFPQSQVKVHDANEQTPVELTELSEKKNNNCVIITWRGFFHGAM
jgi:hypothetical protein